MNNLIKNNTHKFKSIKHFLTSNVIVIVGLLLLSVMSCNNGSNHGNTPELDRLADECSLATIQGRFSAADSLASKLLEMSESENSKLHTGEAYYYLGTYHAGIKNSEMPARRKNLETARAIAVEENFTDLLCKVQNAKGIWNMSAFHDYESAARNFKNSLKLAETLGDERKMLMTESNLSELYRLISDTLGHSYDVNVYERARKLGEKDIEAAALFHCADYAIRHNRDTALAQRYITELIEIDRLPHLPLILKSELAMTENRLSDALKLITQASAQPGLTTDEKGYCNWLLAKILNRKGQFAASDTAVNAAMREYGNQRFGESWIELVGIQSSNAYGLGDMNSAYRLLHKYYGLKDSLAVMVNRQQLNSMKIEYEVEKKNAELALRDERFRRYMTIYAIVFILLVGMVVSYYVHTRRRRRYYESIVRQYKSSLAREEDLKRRLERSLSVSSNDGTNATEIHAAATNSTKSGLSDKTIDEIFTKILHEVEQNEIYRDPTVTREVFAERVGCNRTYFSEAIKRKTGMSYSRFMNSYRVRKAVEILSGPTCPDSMKELAISLGFLSTPPFYSSFKEELGMSPMKFSEISNNLNTNDI